jgi:drug/metabolite transporter (DMT)-like permease
MTLQTPMMAFANWWLRGVRPPRFTLGCIVFVLVGALLVVTKGSPAAVMSGGHALGDMLIFLGAASWVVYTLGSGSFPTWS